MPYLSSHPTAKDGPQAHNTKALQRNNCRRQDSDSQGTEKGYVMKQICMEFQRRTAVGDVAKKIFEKTFCSYLLVFDPAAYVFWPVGFQILSSPQVE